ncbi:MAG: hypothetical protein QOH60_458 [Mycobacterium sp.]|jgi:hypothetical protein|nr:hypothetical protein [Mycobacterium sp.]
MAKIIDVSMEIDRTASDDFQLTVGGTLVLTQQDLNKFNRHGGFLHLQTHVMDKDKWFDDHVWDKPTTDTLDGPLDVGPTQFVIDPFIVSPSKVADADPWPEENVELYVSVRVSPHEVGAVSTGWASSDYQSVKVRSLL